MIFALISVASGNLAFTAEHETPEVAFAMTPATTPRGLMAVAGFLPIVMAVVLAFVGIAFALMQDDAEPAEIETNKRQRVKAGVKKLSIGAKVDDELQKLMAKGDGMIKRKNEVNQKSLEHAQKDDVLALKIKHIQEEDDMKEALMANEVANVVMDLDEEQQKLDNVVGHLENQAYGGQVNAPAAVVVQQPGPMAHIPAPQHAAPGQQKHIAGQW